MTPSSPRVPCGSLDRVTRIFQSHEAEECASHPRTAGLGPGEGGSFPLAVTRSPGDGSVNRYPNPETSHCASRTKSLVNGQSTNHRIPFYRLTDQTLWLLMRGFSGLDGAAVDHGHDPVEIIGGCELDGDPALVPTDGDLHPGVKVIGEKRRDGCFTF